jgi:type I restriction enzyme M protein
MEACVVVCRTAKPRARKRRILFVNAVDEVTRERAQSYLTDDHIERIVGVYRAFEDDAGFARVATLDEIRAKDGNLSIPLYVGAAVARQDEAAYESDALPQALGAWLASSIDLRRSLARLFSEGATQSTGLEILRDDARDGPRRRK